MEPSRNRFRPQRHNILWMKSEAQLPIGFSGLSVVDPPSSLEISTGPRRQPARDACSDPRPPLRRRARSPRPKPPGALPGSSARPSLGASGATSCAERDGKTRTTARSRPPARDLRTPENGKPDSSRVPAGSQPGKIMLFQDLAPSHPRPRLFASCPLTRGSGDRTAKGTAAARASRSRPIPPAGRHDPPAAPQLPTKPRA